MTKGVVIVGAGHAGGRAALSLRSKGFEGAITLLGDEAFPPYERPPLSKGLLIGNKQPEECFLVESSQWEEKSISLRLDDPVESISLAEKTVSTANHESFAYEKLVVATGGRCRKAEFPGVDLKYVFDLRNIEDSKHIQRHLFPEQRVVIVGGGFIGLEVAAAAIQQGCQVSVVEMGDRLLSRVFPKAVSTAIQDFHEHKGVKFYFSDSISEAQGNESVNSVLLHSGIELGADVIVVGIGLIPGTDLAENAGLAVDNGIVCNEFCVASNSDVYAIGDCAKAFNYRSGKYLRLESWQNAEHQAEVVASHITNKPKAWDSVPWFWTDQYEMNIQLAGDMSLSSNLAVRGNNIEQGLIFFSLLDDKLCGAISIASGMRLAKDLRVAQMLIEKEVKVSVEELNDPDVRLKSLLKR
jgi:3-phenylpropionate/trans-cinnamate dioxygenase ferredoxin reductase subunit